jgi:hypothetical protein
MATQRITSIGQISSAIADSSVTRIELNLPTIDSDQAASWERQINDQLGSCGCHEGAAGLFAGLIGSLVAISFAGAGAARSRHAVLLVASAALSGAAFGKSAGRRLGRHRASILGSELSAQMSTNQLMSPGSDEIATNVLEGERTIVC